MPTGQPGNLVQENRGDLCERNAELRSEKLRTIPAAEGVKRAGTEQKANREKRKKVWVFFFVFVFGLV